MVIMMKLQDSFSMPRAARFNAVVDGSRDTVAHDAVDDVQADDTTGVDAVHLSYPDVSDVALRCYEWEVVKWSSVSMILPY
jgi:hypothetical protein